MVTFKYKNGVTKGQTMTVKELIEKLDEYHKDMPVIFTWEGIYTFVDNDDFKVSFEQTTESSAEDCLIIDVNDY